MSEPRRCSECGAPLNNDAPDGFCPACMLEGALRLSPTESSKSHIGEFRGRFGDYELLDEIARGGMGVVYRARQISLDRIVAVKLILSGHFSDKAAVRRFKAEATSAAKLRHPNIVAIHEIGEAAGQHFFSMDYVEGQSLAEFMRQEPISIRQSARFLKTIAEALHYAHEQGIVHRDLKPSNILIDGLLEPRITDFGLARDLKADSDLTLTGQVLGSPNYISPEQASGKAAVGVPSDIYSLGAILYHLLSGRPPFAGETLTDTLHQVNTREAVAPRLLNPSVPRDLETICLKCLEKEPSKRYPTAAALAGDLGRFLEDSPIVARPVSRAERAWRWCRRKPVVAGLSAAVALSIVLGFAGILWQWRRAENKAEESRRNLYAADMILAQAAIDEGNTGHAQELLRKYLPRKGEKDLRGWEWRYAWNRCRSDELFALQGHTSTVSMLALSTNGAILASGGHEGNVVLWDVEKKTAIKTLKAGNAVQGLAFSGDEKELIVGTTDGQVTFWNCETGQPGTVFTNLTRVRSLTVSPDGKTLAFFGLPKLTLWNLADRRPITNLALRMSNEYIPGGLAFSPDSSLLAFSRGDGPIVLCELPQAKRIAELVGHTRYATALAFSRDGSMLISGSRDRTVRVWDMTSRKELKRIGLSAFVCGIAFSPDETLLAVVGADQRVRLFETRSWEEIDVLTGHLDAIWSVTFGRDGKILFTGSKDSTIRAWTVSPTNRHGVVRRLPAGTLSAPLSPDGRSLYLVHSRTYSFWRTDPVEEIARYSLPTADFASGLLSPDGKLCLGWTSNGIAKLFDHVKQQFVAGFAFSPARSSFGRVFAFSADGQMLAGRGNDSTCRVWRITRTAEATPVVSEVCAFPISRQPIWSFRFSDTGHLLTIGDEEGLTEVWDVTSHPKRAVLAGDGSPAMDTVISRDESAAAIASGGGKVRIWDLTSGRETASLGGQLGSLQSVAFSPDETRLAACGGDGTVRIWDMQSRQQVAILKLHFERLNRVAFRSDDTLIAVAIDGFGDARIFTLRAPKLAERQTFSQ